MVYVYHTYNIHQPGYSIRDLFIPDRWKSPSQPLKLTKNCQDYRFYHYCPVWTLSWLLGLVHQHMKCLTLPETNSSPLKMMVSNRNLQTSRGLFSKDMLASGSVFFVVKDTHRGFDAFPRCSPCKGIFTKPFPPKNVATFFSEIM